MDLNNFGTSTKIKVADKLTAISIDIIAAHSLNYGGNVDTAELLAEQKETLRKRVCDFADAQLKIWTQQAMATKIIGSQKQGDAQVDIDKFVETTNVNATLYDNFLIQLRIGVPSGGILLWGNKPLEVLKAEYNKLRAKITDEVTRVLYDYGTKVNLTPKSFDDEDLGFLFAEEIISDEQPG